MAARDPGKIRTFVAIEPGDSVRRRAAAVAQRLQPYAPQARWVDEESLHLTLTFLGELSERQVEDACAQVEWAARANEPFEVRLAGVGAFPDLAGPRAVWLGVTDGADELRRLQADVADAVADLLPSDPAPPFHPHLTLCRLARTAFAASGGLAGGIAALATHDAGTTIVDSITVFASDLYPRGPEYTPMATWQLGMPRR
jgi:2'-5' RNA ligase